MDKKSLERLKENVDWLEKNFVGEVSLNTFLRMILLGVELNNEDLKKIVYTVRESLK